MYLLVIVTLIIGILGIYAQVLSLQAAQLLASQSGMAKTMITWHYGAVSMGAKIIDNLPTAGLTLPCSLTYSLPSGSLPRCNPPNTSPPTMTSGTVTDGSNHLNYLTTTEKVHLPDSYKADLYQFYSVLYMDSTNNQHYVVTFVQPPVISASNPAPGYIALPPTGHLTSLGLSDLARQLHNAGLPGYAYGSAKNGAGTSVLVPASAPLPSGVAIGPSSGNFQYNLPLAGGTAIVGNRGIGIVSSTAGF